MVPAPTRATKLTLRFRNKRRFIQPSVTEYYHRLLPDTAQPAGSRATVVRNNRPLPAEHDSSAGQPPKPFVDWLAFESNHPFFRIGGKDHDQNRPDYGRRYPYSIRQLQPYGAGADDGSGRRHQGLAHHLRRHVF